MVTLAYAFVTAAINGKPVCGADAIIAKLNDERPGQLSKHLPDIDRSLGYTVAGLTYMRTAKAHFQWAYDADQASRKHKEKYTLLSRSLSDDGSEWTKQTMVMKVLEDDDATDDVADEWDYS